MPLDIDGLPMRMLLSALFTFLAAHGAFVGRGVASPSMLCESAAQYAATETGVPLSILRAVTLAETGRTNQQEDRFAAWPWAVQSGNKGNWFADAPSAISYVNGLMAQGTRNIDVGCFQLNFRWHGQAFPNIETMFSPRDNALYAAQFLQRLYAETGDWRQAVGHYHSRSEPRAQAYVSRLKTLYEAHLAAAPPVRQPQVRKVAPVPSRYGLVGARGPLINLRRKGRPMIGGLQ
ncbi:lytic transglycosylase domain-containing protein [Pseudorhodobacter turbinis]|uniref:Lytic transglycosylase domain-containing protein n=1 Tax=Pseudorhodobacter turbinis TaxID=2500533 RepID=A0A4P8EG56_9RHOB|nr:transglycosylase SLT domain-containing protein [Pseudorhodobacter turbinis]QCO55693.1 lytic transglycosylase domain-containing protein [Pseudorhodobacter turbinis]